MQINDKLSDLLLNLSIASARFGEFQSNALGSLSNDGDRDEAQAALDAMAGLIEALKEVKPALKKIANKQY